MTTTTSERNQGREWPIHREYECSPLPRQLEDFRPVVHPGLHSLLHGDDDRVGLVVGAVLGALLGGT